MQVLIVEDQPEYLGLLTSLIEGFGHQVTSCRSVAEAWSHYQRTYFPLVVTDWVLLDRDSDGLKLCQSIRDHVNGKYTYLLLITGRTDPGDLTAALNSGADDYLGKSMDVQMLKVRFRVAINNGKNLSEYMDSEKKIDALRKEMGKTSPFHGLIGQSEPMKSVFSSIRNLAQLDLNVLIHGETGTGKELVARAIHKESRRANAPFVAINCGALTETLINSQLFGHKRGSFSGAMLDQKGVFEDAHGGVLFLDEIGDLPLNIQPNLLRVLENGEITRIGETRSLKIDVRIVSASHKDLRALIQEGRFREDLFYRLRIGEVKLPPLRARSGDLLLLTQVFLADLSRLLGKPLQIQPDALKKMMSYAWPGNVRELKNALSVAAANAQGNTLEARHLPMEIAESSEQSSALPGRDALIAALHQTQGNRAAAARMLGMSRATFYRRLSEFGMS